MPDDGLSEFDRASASLRALGLTLRAVPGEYLIKFRNGADHTARSAADLGEAIAIAEAMAEAMALDPADELSHRHPLSSAKRYRRRFVRRHNKWFRRRSIRHGRSD